MTRHNWHMLWLAIRGDELNFNSRLPQSPAPCIFLRLAAAAAAATAVPAASDSCGELLLLMPLLLLLMSLPLCQLQLPCASCNIVFTALLPTADAA